MSDGAPYQLLADVVLTLHVGVVAFVVGGLVLVIIGNVFKWQRVNVLWFRLAHLGALGAVVVLGYSLFGLLVLAAWWCFPPSLRHHKKNPWSYGRCAAPFRAVARSP